MQIISSSNSQALNAPSTSIELRSQEAQKVLSSVANLSSQEELSSSRSAINRDRVTLSAEASALSRLAGSTGLNSGDGELVGLESNVATKAAGTSQEQKEVEEQELEISRELAERDREVKAHEQTHASIGGVYASAPSYTYERGPDGRMYAVEGEVKIDTSPIPNDPEATLEKAEVIQRAALSVSEPSSADRAAAADARAMAIDARMEILQQEREAEVARTEQRSEANEGNSEDTKSAGDVLRELRDESLARSESSAEVLSDYNDRINEINKQLAEINKKLVDAGVFQKLFPEGSLLDNQV
ncbi:putative metalloprotease CJM1_0395 family protein [Neptuniibacter sp. 1_MG-2023]|uniref:putative metalloprotease CJM1_0395 family protein n=1 Tax=Neptuniibacter sp. 1_MG-2023 TaxID=3062662 RepID=UPI0026E4144F|nr:putative metalloprotease CJM1_0395 family protein [Neptuniibacter sp. 1_MG-2023]MDO6592849.1 putative metalloprotease CJM1_0395 family protein [Neptuniibacter sp. 1_MG-2023]